MHQENTDQIRRQIYMKKKIDQIQSNFNSLREEQADKMLKEDETLVAVYPKLKNVPENVKKKISKRESQKLTASNKQMLDAQITERKKAEKLVKEAFNEENRRL